jgi:hypothetical protein
LNDGFDDFNILRAGHGENKMTITNIDFHIDEHLIQVGQGIIRIFKNGDTRKEPIEFDALEVERILRISIEQLDDWLS